MVPFITREPTLGQHVRESVFGVNTCDLDMGPSRILSDNQSNATPWLLDTCLIVGLLPLMIILITASGVFENIQLTFTLRRICVVCDNVIYI